MKIVKPAYYDAFQCLAAACPDSCCKEWDVLVDPTSAEFYRSLTGPLGQRLQSVLTTDDNGDTYMTIEDRRCPMWRQDGLCRIQAELGHDALCKTCRDFPRLTHDYGDFVEQDLELSCPEAARLILRPHAAEDVVAEVPGGDAPDYDPSDMALLQTTRQQVLSFLSDTERPVKEALALLLLYGYHAQSLLDGMDIDFDPDSALSEAAEFAKTASTEPLCRFFAELEILNSQWLHLLEAPTPLTDWPDALRSLAIYGVRRYWLQAISDYDLAGRVKMVLVSCLLVRHLGGRSARHRAAVFQGDREQHRQCGADFGRSLYPPGFHR